MTTLESRIRAAFADSQYPGDDQLTVYDPQGREFDETFRLLRGTAWESVDVQEFLSGDTPVPDLTPKAFCYYLPALLITALKEAPDIANLLVFYFTPSSSDLFPDAADGLGFRAGLEERLSLLTREQRLLIADVLCEFVDRRARGAATRR